MTRLSDTQTILLSTAAARKTGSVLPAADAVSVRGRGLLRTLTALQKRGLVAEKDVRDETAIWRRAENGGLLGLAITAAGFAAIGLEPDERAGEEKGGADLDGAGTTASADRPSGKLGTIVAAVAAEQGATIDELAGTVGWQKHTTRAALTRLRQRGFDIRLATIGERKAYRLAVPA